MIIAIAVGIILAVVLLLMVLAKVAKLEKVATELEKWEIASGIPEVKKE